jgi:signal transduction histidine kinase
MLKRGIKQKLIVSLVITTLILMSLFFVLLDSYLKSYSISEMDQTIFFLGENTAPLLQKPLFSFDYNQLKKMVQPLLIYDFGYLVIIDNSSLNVAFKEDKAGITDTFNWEKELIGIKGIQRRELSLEVGKFTQFIFPIKFSSIDKPLGFLVIGISDSKMKSKLVGITYRILIVSILLFIALTINIYILSDKIVKPIKALSLKISKFASGDYSVRSDIDTSDEIGNLSYNFNFMADKINEQILSIEKYSKNLEKMVEERTTELLKALDAIKEKDNKLNQAEKIKSLNAIVSSIAHEINNPMAIISGNLQMIEAKVVSIGDEKLIKNITAAQVAVERIATLIEEINFFATIKEAGTETIVFSKILNISIMKTVPKNVKLEIDGIEKGSPDDEIESNDHLLSIALECVLKNSVEIAVARNIEPKINVKYYRDSPYFVIEISDNAGGCDNIENVFNPFFTTFNEKKGLGLTFVYHALQALNGDVEFVNILDDETREKGAKVTLRLPVEIESKDEEVDEQWQQ